MTKKASKDTSAKTSVEEAHKGKKNVVSKKPLKAEGAFKSDKDVEQFIHSIYSIRKIDVISQLKIITF